MQRLIMKNPWEEIKLSDYENHMKLNTVMQLQTLNIMMKKQLNQNNIKTVMILGIAGGNGLEHIDPNKFQKVYGVDINHEYLKECEVRYENLKDILECLCVDLTDKNAMLPSADMVIANLLIEYIGYECFQKVVAQVNPEYVSCIIQVNTDDSFVSDSPYLHVFDNLDQVHHQIQEDELIIVLNRIGYRLTGKVEEPLPNGKKLVQLDFLNLHNS